MGNNNTGRSVSAIIKGATFGMITVGQTGIGFKDPISAPIDLIRELKAEFVNDKNEDV